MERLKNKNKTFDKGLKKLGFRKNDSLFFHTEKQNHSSNPQIKFLIEKARDEFNASAIYLRKLFNGSYKIQVLIFDFTQQDFTSKNEFKLADIQKKIWSSGEAPLACTFYRTEIKIIDCTTHLTADYRPTHLVDHLLITGKAHHLYNKEFALKVKSGLFWEEDELSNKFKFHNSAYDKLIENIRHIAESLKQAHMALPNDFIHKIIVQSILIKYLEERIDNNDKKLLSDKYFKKYNNSKTFNDVLRKGEFVNLLKDLNDSRRGFNGNVFDWKRSEQDVLQKLNLDLLADLLDTKKTSLGSSQLEFNFTDWRYFEFSFIPVELISRLYEEFLGSGKKDSGLYYTPSHLAKLLVDESLPLNKYDKIDLNSFTILDPACGSGIFLVTTFKRLVQIWRLQNNMKLPDQHDLKKILRNIYGVDKEDQAVRLTSFSLSLALCNELKPIEIINKLKFDDLRKNNLMQNDFFNYKKEIHFDLILGNPPFNRGAINKYDKFWKIENKKVKIPQGQIALKFLSESIPYLKKKGLLCLIIKASGLLYNSTSTEYKRLLLSNYNVIQLFDFTSLARNKSLWDNGADVATTAIFLRNEPPNYKKNILHVTFRRTKATKERIIFEIDDYDLHFVDRQVAIENNSIWKNNLLGGGRIKTLLDKFKNTSTLENFLKNNDLLVSEGYIIGTKGTKHPNYIFTLPTLSSKPSDAINKDGIDYTQLSVLDKNVKFEKVPPEEIFTAPNIVLWENIGEKKLPVFYNEKSFSFKDKLIGIGSRSTNKKTLKSIVESFNSFSDFYRFHMFTNSSQVLINKNTAILKQDYMQLPFILGKNRSLFSESDYNIISDVNTYMQDFIRHGENSKAVKSITKNELVSVFSKYGKEFSRILNLVYEEKDKRFRLSDVINLGNSLIATIFKYDTKTLETVFHSDNSKLTMKELTDFEVSKKLTIKRIIKLYPQKNTIVFIKPNQYKYWLSISAYRDADKCFYDLSI